MSGRHLSGAAAALTGSLVLLAVLTVAIAAAPWADSAFKSATLALTALGLAAVGGAVARVAGWEVARGNPALQIGIGQFTLMAWMVGRSLLSSLTAALGNIELPCTGLELLLVGLAIVCAGFRTNAKAADIRSAAPAMLVVAIAVLACGLRELPRVIALSSDPDQHSFWTQQLIIHGRVPWHLGAWGPLDFQYPAGFALMARLWTVGAIGAIESVGVQPLVQSVLAVAALATWMSRQFGASKSSRDADPVPSRVVLLLAGMVLFFALLPYSLTKHFTLLQKTGNISSLLLMVVIAACLQMLWTGSHRASGWAAGAIGVLLGIAALINPIAAILPVVVCLAILAAWAWRHSRLPWRWIGLALVCLVLVLLADPYYVKRFVLRLPPPTPEMATGLVATQAQDAMQAYRTYAWQYIRTAEWLRPWLLIPFLAHAWIAPLLVAASVGTLVAKRRLGRAGWFAILGLPAVCTLAGLLLMPLFHAVANHGDLYLLEPYMKDALGRVGYLWLFALLMAALAAVLAELRFAVLGWTLLSAGIPLLYWPLDGLRSALPTEVILDARANDCGDTRCDFTDDMKLLSRIREQGLVPEVAAGRLLVPNKPMQIWLERWIFPVGFARALPLHWPGPVAFFYGKGHPDFTYGNYMNHVCTRLDTAWLKARDVHFLFVPSDRDKACVHQLDELLSGPNVLLREGKAALIRL